jgi:hypothetical protein
LTIGRNFVVFAVENNDEPIFKKVPHVIKKTPSGRKAPGGFIFNHGGLVVIYWSVFYQSRRPRKVCFFMKAETAW